MDPPLRRGGQFPGRTYWLTHIALGLVNLYFTVWLIGLLRVLFAGWQGHAYNVPMNDLVRTVGAAEISVFLGLTCAFYASHVLLAMRRSHALIAMAIGVSCHLVLWLMLTTNPVYDATIGMAVIAFEVGVLILMVLLRYRRGLD